MKRIIILAVLAVMSVATFAYAAADNVVINSISTQSEVVEYGTSNPTDFTVSATGDAGAGDVDWEVSGFPGGVSVLLSDDPSSGAGAWSTTITLENSATVVPGTYTITVTANSDGFNLGSTDTFDYEVSPRTISSAGITADDKEYDQSTVAAVSGALTELINGDVVTVDPVASFSPDGDVGTGKAVVLTLGGADASKYIVGDASADITPKDLYITGGDYAKNTKVYDGTTDADLRNTFQAVTHDGIGGDDVEILGGVGTFADKHVANGKTVTFSGFTLGGTDGGNYTLMNQPAPETQNVTVRSITVRPVNDSKVYDGTASSSLTPTVTTGSLVGSDTGVFTQVYDTATVGTGKDVISSGIVNDGNGGANYSVTHTPRHNSEITPLALTITGLLVNDKIYDKTTTATLAAGGTLVGVIAPDDVSPETGLATATYDDENAGTGKTVTVAGITLSGVDAGNYTITQPVLTGTILPRPISITAVTASKEYDGNVSASGASFLSAGTLVVGDSAVYSQEFATKDAGTGKTINPLIAITDGNGGNNYDVTEIVDTTGVITAKALAVTAVGNNKVYDGTVDATVVFSDDRLGLDDLTVSGTAVFDTEHVGVGKAVSVTGISLSGPDAGNYTPNTTTGTTADITARTLTVSITGDDKVYDGTRNATITTSDDRVLGDDVILSYPVAGPDRPLFGNRHVGTGKNVTVNAISISGGADMGNYTLGNTTAVDTDVDITPATLVVGFSADDKVYDGTDGATISLSSITSPLLNGGDAVTVTPGTATFSDEHVGNDKAVTGVGFTLGGAQAGNYVIGTITPTTADITPKTLSVTATGIDKTYDGNTSATVTFGDDRVAGDDLTITGTATFATEDVDTGIVVTVTGIVVGGPDAGNYSANTDTVTSADITPAPITISATAGNKVYDGNTDAIATLLVTPIGADDVTASYTDANFDTKHVGTGKTVTVTGITLGGADAGNYSVGDATALADITPAPLTVSFTADNKVYDGTTDADILSRSLSGVLGLNVVTVSGGTADFDTKHVGTGKAVTATGFTLGGTDGGNYEVTTVTPATADITAKTLVVTAVGNNKVYDGTTLATVVFSDDRLGLDDLTVSGTAHFDTKHVGTDKDIDVTGIVLSGADAGNYTPNTTTSTTGDVTVRALAITATGINKVYDGTTSATVTLGDNRVAGDILTTSGTATFDTAEVGTGKTVTVAGIVVGGADAGNYSANTDTITSADITARRSSGGSGSRVRRDEGEVLGAATSTVATTTATSTYQFVSDLYMGMNGADVVALQAILIAKGYLQIPLPTGYFGPLTFAAVQKYQAANGIITTGYVGPLTRAALNAGK